jgi:AbrB family looped-hinge helix DNA binding protein
METLKYEVRQILPMEIAITKISSKGQIVIPAEMRKGLKKGDKMVIIQNEKQLILEKADNKDKQLIEDLEFARRTNEAYERIKKGKGKTMDFDEFIKEIKTW